jgi:hypothetical protein
MTSRISKLRRQWKLLGLPAFVAALSPWFARLIKLELISPFYQPYMGAFATLLGAVAAMVAVAWLIDQTRSIQQRWLWRGVWPLGFGFPICLLLTLTVGVVWTFDPMGFVVIHLIWIAAYLGMFAGLGWIIGSAYLLLATDSERR